MSYDPTDLMYARSMQPKKHAANADPNFDAALRKLAHNYGLRLGDVDLRSGYSDERGYRQANKAEFDWLHNVASYNFQNKKNYDYGGDISYDPWSNPTEVNEARAKFVSTNKRAPTATDDWKPIKYKVNEGVKTNLQQWYSGIQNLEARGQLTPENVQSLWSSLGYINQLTGYAEDQERKRAVAEQKRQEAIANDEYIAGDFPLLSEKKEETDKFDYDYLKQTGYDEKTGYSGLLNDAMAAARKEASVYGRTAPGEEPVTPRVERIVAGLPQEQRQGIYGQVAQQTARDVYWQGERQTEAVQNFVKGTGNQAAYQGKDLQWMVTGGDKGQGVMSGHITSKISGINSGNYVITPGQIQTGLLANVLMPGAANVAQGGKYFTLTYIDDKGNVKQTEKFATAGFAQYAANKYREDILAGKAFKKINQLDPNAIKEYLATLPADQQQNELAEIKRYTVQGINAYVTGGGDAAVGLAKSLWTNYVINEENKIKALSKGDTDAYKQASSAFIPNAGWRELSMAAAGGDASKAWATQLDESWAGQQLNNVIDMLGDPLFYAGGEIGIGAGIKAAKVAKVGSFEESMAAITAAKKGGVMAPAAELSAMERGALDKRPAMYVDPYGNVRPTAETPLQLQAGPRGPQAFAGKELPQYTRTATGEIVPAAQPRLLSANEYGATYGARLEAAPRATGASLTAPKPEAAVVGPRGNIGAAAPENVGVGIAGEIESEPFFRGQELGGANPAARPAQAFETSASGLTYKDKLKIAIQDVIDPQRSLKYLPGTKGLAGETNAVYRGAITSKNVQNQIANIYEVALVDKGGNKIGDSLSKVLRDNVPQGQELEFWTTALQKHNIARAGEGKPIFSQIGADGKEVFFSAAESKAAYDMAIRLHPEWAGKIDNITGWLKKFEKAWGVDTGLFTAKTFKELGDLNPNYLPTNRAFNDLEDFMPGSGTAKGFVDQSNTLRRATGSTRNIVDPTENIISLVNRTVRTARLNEVGQLFVDAVRKNPTAMKPIAEIVDAAKGNVDNVLRVLEKGEPVYIKVNDAAVLDALTQLSAVRDLGKLEKVSSKITGFMKQAITTKNPIFGILNGFRDLPTYLAFSQVNPVKALGSYARAGAEIVASDIVNPALRKLTGKEIPTPQLQQFRALGGEGATLTGAAPSVKKAQQLTGRVAITDKATGAITGYRDVNPVARLGKWIGKESQKFNTAIEAAPRYAEFLNARKAGKSLEEALYDAAEVTTNFSRGGKILKEADHFFIYLNASVQGLSRLARAINPLNPGKFISTVLKGGAAITLPQIILTEINKDNPNYQALDNRIKDAYFCIPNNADLDENGYPKTFIRIPRSRELGVLLGAGYERIYRAARGEKDAFKGFGQSVATNFSPIQVNPMSIVPTAGRPIADLVANKDFAGRAIVPESMKARSPHLQYDEKTSEPSKWLANALYDVAGIDLSPKQLDYLADSYLGIISDVGLPITTKSTYEKGLGAVVSPITRRFTADPLYSNQSITDFYDELDRLETLAADVNFEGNISSKASTPEERIRSILSNAAKDMSDLSKQLNTAADPATIRKQMIQIAKDALAAAKTGGGSKTIYPPGVDDQKRDAYDKIVNESKNGIPEKTMQEIFAMFAQLKPKSDNVAVYASDRKIALAKWVASGKLTAEQYRTFIKYYYPND